jgi:hypothetical protein
VTVSENGIEVQRRSLQERAKNQNVSEDSILRDLADLYKQRIVETLESIELLEIPGESRDLINQVIISQRTARDLLTEDPSYVLVYRQQELELLYKQLLLKLAEWLKLSEAAQDMLSSSHLRAIENDLNLSSDGSLTERCLRIAGRVEVASPLTSGFNARIISLIPLLELSAGLPDCLHAACSLIATMSAEEDEGRIRIKNLRNHPQEFQEGVTLLQGIVAMSVGKSPTAKVMRPPPATPHRVGLAQKLYEGAFAAVICHELAHFLTPVLPNEHEDEHKCDAFAAHLLSASRDPSVICGLYIAQMLQNIIKTEDEGWKGGFDSENLSTHPRTVFRIHRVATIAELHGLMPTGPFDDLLAIPTRLMEEETFKHSTQWDVFSKLYDHFANMNGSDLDPETRRHIPAGLAAATRLPTIAESTEVTLQPEGRMRARIITFEMRKAIIATNMVLNRRLSEDNSISEKELAEAMIRSHKKAIEIALEGLAVLSKKPKPPFIAVEIMNTLIPAKSLKPSMAEIRSLLDREQYQNGLTILLELGCVKIEGMLVIADTPIKLRLLHRPRYDD